MEKINYELFVKLKKYYNENCKSLIFVGEKILKNNNKCKMYFCDTTMDNELNNYKKVFQEYLALYVRNYDRLHYYKDLIRSSSNSEISTALLKYGKDIWTKSALIKTSSPKTLGIYGEAINDFYLNIVKNENILITYSTKNSFNDRSIKGIDVIATLWEDKNLTLVFSECKFVESIYKASDGLYNDIVGTEKELPHVSSDYINRYMNFIVDKQHSIFSEISDSQKIMSILEILNNRIINYEKPIDVINDLQIKIRFNFFAIYNDNRFTPDEVESMYNKVLNAFNIKVESTGLKKYDIEIVYIPVKNSSSEVKEKMREWD